MNKSEVSLGIVRPGFYASSSAGTQHQLLPLLTSGTRCSARKVRGSKPSIHRTAKPMPPIGDT